MKGPENSPPIGSLNEAYAPQQGGAVVADPGHFLRLELPAIHYPRFTASEMEKYAAPLKTRISELEAELAARDGGPVGGIDDKDLKAIPD